MHISVQDLHNREKLLAHKEAVDTALLEQPDNPDAYIVKAVMHLHENEFEEALKYAKQAIGLNAAFAGHYVTIASVYGAMGDIEQSAHWLQKGLDLCDNIPSLNFNYSMYLLQQGNFKLGWEMYKWRKVHLPGHIRLLEPEWDYTQKVKPDSTLFIWCEQGLGDQIMAFRFIKYMKEKFGFAKVIVECNAQLYNLFQHNMEGIDMLYVQRSDNGTNFEFDYHCSMMDLPFNLQLKDWNDFYDNGTYLHANPIAKEKWRIGLTENPQIKDTLNIGICWKGSKSHQNDRNRSATLDDFVPLIPHGNLFSLQMEGGDQVPEGMDLLSVQQGIINADLTAALISNLNYVVTVDTFVAHLAGSLGILTLMLLPYVSEWRWGMDPTNGRISTIYPSVKTFRQSVRGSWKEPMQEIVDYLTKKGVGDAKEIETTSILPLTTEKPEPILLNKTQIALKKKAQEIIETKLGPVQTPICRNGD